MVVASRITQDAEGLRGVHVACAFAVARSGLVTTNVQRQCSSMSYKSSRIFVTRMILKPLSQPMIQFKILKCSWQFQLQHSMENLLSVLLSFKARCRVIQLRSGRLR
jgi:hypothetical protein